MVDFVFIGNRAVDHGGVLHAENGDVILTHCCFAGNEAGKTGGVLWSTGGDVRVANCTAAGNRASAGCFIFATPSWSSSISLANSIVADAGNEVRNESGTTAVFYSNIRAGGVAAVDPNATLIWGPGNIEADPCFVDAGHWDLNNTPGDPNDDFYVEGDYHLRSRVGRWDSSSLRWPKDETHSLCIDAGDPYWAYEQEAWPHGQRVNLGVYGDTVEASLSQCGLGIRADVDNNEAVNVRDFVAIGQMWLNEAASMRADLNKDAKVDVADLQLFSAEWPFQPSELRFADYWPFVLGDRWGSVHRIADSGAGFTIEDRLSVNEFDVCQVKVIRGSHKGALKQTVYYVFVNGALYSTTSKTQLERLPDVTEGFSLEWPEFVQMGQPTRHLDELYTPLRTTLKKLAVWFQEQEGWDILPYHSPENYSLDVLAFADEDGALIAAFGRRYGPVIYTRGEAYCMIRRDPSQ